MKISTEDRLSDAESDVAYATRELCEAAYEVEKTLWKHLVAPVISIIIGVVATVWLAFLIPQGGMDTGGNWAAGWMCASVFLILMGVAVFHDARADHKSAPAWLEHMRETVAACEQEVAELTARLESEKEQKRLDAIEAKRAAKLHAAMMGFSDFVASLPAGADDDEWVKLREVHGWSTELATLLRGAAEARALPAVA